MSSSPERPIDDAAIVFTRHDQGAGPVRLPSQNAESFIESFNATYRKFGVRLQPIVDRKATGGKKTGAKQVHDASTETPSADSQPDA